MNFDDLLQEAEKFNIPRKLIEIWIPKEKFLDAVTRDNSLSITRVDDPYFGFGFGPNPPIDPRWSQFTFTRSTPKEITKNFKLVGQWDAYGMDTKKFEIEYQLLSDFKTVNAMIEDNAPELSIRAEDDEVVAWVGIEDFALGAICKWESGGHVLSAIVVAKEKRGKGYGKSITKALLTEAKKRGINYVALGVLAKNESAISTYKAVGFQELGKFNTFNAC